MSDLKDRRGIVATVVLTGNVMEEYSKSLMEARAFCIEKGFTNIEWDFFPAQLVEAGRDAVIQHALNNKYEWALMIDADAVFNSDLVVRMLETAFESVPESDAVSAYAQLKHEPYLPVIDTGTGTWEAHFPGEGVLECIRVGGHCLLVKASAWQRMEKPWFRTRSTLRPVDALREVDNYARINFDGVNPFGKMSYWKDLMDQATEEHGGVVSTVGEDSGFCDKLKASGGRIFVNCDIVTGHMKKTMVKASDLRESLQKRYRKLGLAVGVNKCQ